MEADLRADLFLVLSPYATETLGIPPEDVRQEGTGRSGRFDSMFGRCVIEYKRPHLLDSVNERHAAAAQAVDYLDDSTIGAEVLMVTDGHTWGLLRDESATPEVGEQGWLDLAVTPTSPAERFTWRVNSPETAARALALLATVRAAPVSAVSIVARLGPGTDEVVALLNSLRAALTASPAGSRPGVLFRQWLQLAGVAYGIDAPDSAWPKPPAQILGARLTPVLGPATYAEAVFVLHTYVALASKLIAAEMLALIAGDHESRPTQWLSLSDSELCTKLRALERGDVTASLRAPDLLAGDLFGWYTPLLSGDPQLVGTLRVVLEGFSKLAWARVANARGVAGDLLREFYSATVPTSMRRSLGEFFTPQWIAERILTRAAELSEASEAPLRVMDPACGSGSFLVAALRRAVSIQLAQGGSDEGAAVLAAVESVVGCDINPVAVLMSRVNLLLALGERVDLLPSISFHVYQSDSILLPDIVRGQKTLGEPDTRRLALEIGPIDVPSPLATLDGLRTLRVNIESGVSADRSPERFAMRLRAEVNKKALVAPEELDEAVAGAVDVYARITELAAAGKNGIWARIIEQSFAPAMLRPVDVVVGNPPWINWKHLPDAWQQRSRPVWEAWGMWQTQQKGGGVPLADVSSLLFARSVSTYCREGGIVALLLPQSALLADPGGRSLRRCHLRGTHEPSGRWFAPEAIDDFSRLNPFSPDAANKPVALYARVAEKPVFPVPQTTWERATAGSKIKRDQAWPIVRLGLNSIDRLTGPIEELESPWAPLPNPGDLSLRGPAATPPYVWGQGFHTRGADGLFFVEVTTPKPVGPDHVVRIRSVPSAGKNTASDPVREAEIESEYLWPLVRGQGIDPFAYNASGLYAIIPHDPEDLTKVLTVDQLATAAPRLYDYLERWIDRFARRSPYQELQPTAERPWGIQGPWGHLRRDANLVLSRYIHPAGMPPAAAALPRFDSRLGRVTTVYPNNKCNFLAVTSRDEASYVTGCLNAPISQVAIARFVSTTTIGPAALQRLPFPQFDPNRKSHGTVVEIARGLAEAPNAGLLEQLDLAVREVCEGAPHTEA